VRRDLRERQPVDDLLQQPAAAFAECTSPGHFANYKFIANKSRMTSLSRPYRGCQKRDENKLGKQARADRRHGFAKNGETFARGLDIRWEGRAEHEDRTKGGPEG